MPFPPWRRRAPETPEPTPPPTPGAKQEPEFDPAAVVDPIDFQALITSLTAAQVEIQGQPTLLTEEEQKQEKRVGVSFQTKSAKYQVHQYANGSITTSCEITETDPKKYDEAFKQEFDSIAACIFKADKQKLEQAHSGVNPTTCYIEKIHPPKYQDDVIKALLKPADQTAGTEARYSEVKFAGNTYTLKDDGSLNKVGSSATTDVVYDAPVSGP